MANVFAILSALALAAAAFIAMKNKDKYGEEIVNRQAAEKRLSTSEARLADLQQQFNDTEAERKSTEEAVVGLNETKTAQEKKNKAVEDDIAAKQSETDTNAKKIAEIEDALKELGNIEEMVGKVKRMNEELAQLTDDIAGNDAKLADLTAEKGRTEGVIAAYSKENTNYSTKVSFFSSTRISSIFPAYGFVTLPIGNTSGVVSGSSLDIVRDGAVVGKLRVKSVEAGRAAAEIVPDSVAEDTVLMVGDRVVPSAEAAK
jgi:septal ring factor EnvC (AmiA/AmiB activator)